MKTVIMGAGAMGGLFGALLTLSGEETWLVTPRKDHIDKIKSEGLTLEEQGKIYKINVNITNDVTSIGKADLVLIFVKTYQTEKAVADSLSVEKDETVFLSLQNGIGNEEVICKYVDRKKVLLGVTNHGATLLGPGHIFHAGWGQTHIGELDGRITERALRISKMFQKAGIITEVSDSIYDLIWEKLLINVGINALTALTGLKNGQLLDYPETLRLMELLVNEALEIARAKGIKIEGNPFDKVKKVAEATRENRSSMGQDFDYRRRTEIDSINGAIVREAEKLRIPVPCNRIITDLIKVIERRFYQSQ
jgi:2-dehydropantoate 2-reductase